MKDVIPRMKLVSISIFILISCLGNCQLTTQQNQTIKAAVEQIEGDWQIVTQKKPFYTPKLRLESSQYSLTGDGTLEEGFHTSIGVSAFNLKDSSIVQSHPWTADLSTVLMLKTKSLIIVISFYPWNEFHHKNGEIRKAVAEFEEYITQESRNL